jgi:hypothetical protein
MAVAANPFMGIANISNHANTNLVNLHIALILHNIGLHCSQQFAFCRLNVLYFPNSETTPTSTKKRRSPAKGFFYALLFSLGQFGVDS